MQPARHHVVHEVVARRDGVEHAAYAAFFLAPGDALVAEIGFARAVVVVAIRHGWKYRPTSRSFRPFGLGVARLAGLRETL